MSAAEERRTVEERLTAIESALFPQPVQWTDERIAEFRQEFRQAWDGASGQPPRLMPPEPLLTPELARALFRECVTVVEPGQTLVVRVPESWTPHQVDEYQRYWLHPLAADCGIKAMAVCGEELGVAQ